MSYYPKQYPVLEKTEWRLDSKDELKGGVFVDAILGENGAQVAPARESGSYVTQLIDAGQAVVWKELAWEADLPLGSTVSVRTRFGATEDECLEARWSSEYRTCPTTVLLAGSREMYVNVAAARYLQVRVEMQAGTGGTPTLKAIVLSAGLVAPACVGPMNRAVLTNRRPTFYWTRVEGAASYSFEISSTGDFSQDVFAQHNVSENLFVSPADLREAIYYWRVRCVDGSGCPSDYSPTRELAIAQRPRADSSALQHPYLFFTRNEIPALRQRISSRHAVTMQAIRKKAEDALSAEPWEERDVLLTPGQHSNFHPLAGQVARGDLEALAFTYVMTGDDRYAAKARDVMLRLVAFSRWTGVPFGDPDFCYPVWQATLETAGICKGVATAYDWVHDYLSDDDRATVREGLLRLGVLPAIESWSDPKTIAHIPRHQLPAGNWWSVCNSGAGVGALAMLAEVPDAQRWVEMTADAIRAYLCYSGDDVSNFDMKAGVGGQYLLRTYANWGEDGGYVESLGYVNYGLVNAMYFVDALKRVTGDDLAPNISPRLIDQPFYCWYRGPEGKSAVINFNDSGQDNLSDDLYALLARHVRSGRAAFLLRESYPQLRNIHALVAEDESVKSEPPDADRGGKLFGDIGWCVFRSGWDDNASLLAAKFTHGRGHQDIGQYVVHYRGRPFVIDPGVVSYSDPIYAHLRTSHAHNLVLVDDKCQMPVDGVVLGFAQAPGIGIVQADLTAAYQDLIDSWVRTLVYIEPDCFLVVDRLSSSQERSYSWQVHPSGKIAVQPGLGATIYQDDHEMQLRLIAPHDWRVSTKQGYIAHTPADYLSFAPGLPCRQTLFVAVFTGTERGRNIGVERQEKVEELGVRVITPEASHTILIGNSGDAQVRGWDISARAELCAVTHSKGDDERQSKWVLAGKGALCQAGQELAGEEDEVTCRAGVFLRR